MAKKRPGKPRRQAKSQRGRGTTPAAIVFFAAVALSVVALFFAYAFYYLPSQQAAKAPPAKTQAAAGQGKAAQAPAAPGQQQGQPQGPAGQGQQAAGQLKAPAGQTQAPAPAGQQATGQPQAPAMAAQQAGGQAQAPSLPGQQTAGQAQPAGQQPQGQTATTAPEAKPGTPRLAIVIDDLGGSLEQAADLIALKLPITFSVLPNLAHTKEVDAMAAKAGLEVILHQPFEAQPPSVPAAGTLKAGASPSEVAATLGAHLTQLPHAAGMSNHTGSKATEDAAVMAAAMGVLKQRGLFFLDSLTTAGSAGLKEAAKAGVPAIGRTVFLDNERGQQAALLMLAQAEKEARAKGRAVAIGHPHPETIAALAAWSVKRDKSVQLVTLASLLK